MVLAYYSFKKYEENIVYTESFGQLDDEIGWVLRPRATARVYFESRVTGTTFYDFRVYTNADGLRSASVDSPTPAKGVVAAGDSWVFGTGVDYADSFAARLSAGLGMPVANLGVPAHGTAQTILLLQRHITQLAPKVVVHPNFGLWARSVCRGSSRPHDLLEPCFWKDPSTGAVSMLTPSPGYFSRMSKLGVYPGGWMTAGHNTWAYYLISRPVIQFQQLLTRLGLKSGQFAEDDISTPDRILILRATLERFLQLALKHDFVFVLLDPPGEYADAVSDLLPQYSSRLVYLGQDVGTEARAHSAHIPADRRSVPGDGHFTGEYMASWMEVIAPRVKAVLSR
jgi:hypothetical protein